MVKITESEYRCAYKEVIMIINSLEDEVKKLIPKDKIEFYESHMDRNYNFQIDYDKSINNQKILYPTKCILANIFKEYIASEEDKKLIFEKEAKEKANVENQKREKYNPNEIFNKKQLKSELIVEEMMTDVILEEKKCSIFEKIKNKIIKFFKFI